MKITKSKNLKKKPSAPLGFGKYFTDHMFVMNYTLGKGWHSARIEPYVPLELMPSSSALHYGQAIFEGMKAYRGPENEVLLFRPHSNFERMNVSADRLCIPNVDVSEAMAGLKELLRLEADWIPTEQGTALYIRPFIIANDDSLGVHIAHNYIFCIILSPVGAYYANGFAPIKLLVEEHYVRASLGGTGHIKCAGNYAASLIGSKRATEKGCAQVLWLDAIEKKYVEEVGAMNIFFVIGKEVLTPELSGSILPGVTRASVLELLRSKGFSVSERRISIDEVVEASQNGTLKECFGTGTAAVVSPVSHFVFKDVEYSVSDGKMGQVCTLAYDELSAIQTGRKEDVFSWVEKL